MPLSEYRFNEALERLQQIIKEVLMLNITIKSSLKVTSTTIRKVLTDMIIQHVTSVGESQELYMCY